MLFFGYIVSEVKYKDLQEDIVKVVSSCEECNGGIPKLIVGLEKAKEYAREKGFDFDILNHIYPNGDMWTFKKTEKREFYEEDIETFKKRIVEMQKYGVDYHYVSIFKLRYSDMKRLYRIVLAHTDTEYIIIDRNMVYVPLSDKKVIGLSLTDFNYIGIEREKVIGKIRANKNNRVYFTSSKNMWKFKEWFDGDEYVIATIFTRNAKKKN